MQNARGYLKLAIGVLVIAGLVAAVILLPIGTWLDQFKSYVRGAGPVGYVLYVLVYAVCCVFLIPASALTLGAGAIFGFVQGTILNLIGATLGACAAFLLGRTVFRKNIEKKVASNPKLRAVDKAVEKEGTKLMLLMRLSGFPPFTWINYGLSLTGVKFLPYAITTFVGIIPGTAAFTYLGATGADVASGSTGSTITTIFKIVGAVGAIVVAIIIARIAMKAVKKAGLDTGEPAPAATAPTAM
jgi:uncharacterized membrane protein YdjX (TVP38/TMEM64 family)